MITVIVNCRSVVNKVDDLAALIDSVKADIVFGTESWLDSSVKDSEAFPEDFVAYSKDRSRLGGGVFILVRRSLNSSELDIGHDDVESVWCKVTLPDNSSFAAGAFYRPLNSCVTSLQALYEIVSEASCHTFMLAGDFNLSDLRWRDGTCEFIAGGILNLEMKNIIHSD